MDYKIEKLITTEQRHQLLDVFNSKEAKLAHQDYNLFDVDKRHPTSEQSKMDCFKPFDDYAKDYKKSFQHYFLVYGPDSFTKFHTDNDEAVGLTLVTLLSKTDDLVGGEALAILPYTKRVRPEGKYRKGKAPVDERVIPKVIAMEEGDTLAYGQHLMHGVGQVERGERIVLISWYGRTDNEGDQIEKLPV